MIIKMRNMNIMIQKYLLKIKKQKSNYISNSYKIRNKIKLFMKIKMKIWIMNKKMEDNLKISIIIKLNKKNNPSFKIKK